MEGKKQYSDEEFIDCIESGSFPKEHFNHQAHLRLAFLLCQHKKVDQAIEATCKVLLAYVNTIGATSIYNEELTIASVKLIHHRINSSSVEQSFSEFLAANSDLVIDFKGALETYY